MSLTTIGLCFYTYKVDKWSHKYILLESRSMPLADPYKGPTLGIVALFLFTLPAIVAAIVVTLPEPPVDPWAAAAASLGVSPHALAGGHAVYTGACQVCHGPEAEGVPRLGKPLRNSSFVQTSSDDDLFALVVAGRPVNDLRNTTGVAMPPRGAQALGDVQLRNVVSYLRTLQDPNAPHASLHPWMIPPPKPPSPIPAEVKRPAAVAASSGGTAAPATSAPTAPAPAEPTPAATPARTIPGAATFVAAEECRVSASPSARVRS
jgi:mono/diheme cytochrome c family protein